MRIKVVILAMVGLLLVTGVAEAHKLPYGVAKRSVQQLTAGVCRGLNDCQSWSVGPCQRRSLHRIDCVSKLRMREGGSCAWVSIARVPAHSYEVKVFHKRIFC